MQEKNEKMKNKQTGFLIIGIAVVIAIIVFLFNNAMTNIVNTSCAHGSSCTMYGEIKTQTYVSGAIIAVIAIIGLVLVFSKESEKIIFKKMKTIREAELKPKKFSKKSLDGLNDDEKKIVNLLLENKGSVFQSELVKKTGMNKVKVTRTLDSLEAVELIERKRRGMTNIVLLK